MRNKAQLCYVEGRRAWFTTKELSKQWGDDWDDVPYEHNAGAPYEWYEKSGEPEYHLFTCFFEGAYVTPDEGHRNSPFSVQGINHGDGAWLLPNKSYSKTVRAIKAGTTYEDFVKTVREDGGKVYEDTAAQQQGEPQ